MGEHMAEAGGIRERKHKGSEVGVGILTKEPYEHCGHVAK